MSVSVSTVRESDPDRLVDAADALGRRRSELETILTGERGPTHLQSPTDLPATSIDKGLRRAAPYFNADNALLVVHCQH